MTAVVRLIVYEIPYWSLNDLAISGFNTSLHYKNGNSKSFRYYHCTKKSKVTICLQFGYIKETDLHSQLTTLLKNYILKKTWANQMLLKLKKEESDIPKSCLEVVSIKRKDLEDIDIKQKMLLDTYLDQLIEKEDFQQKKYELMSKRKTIEEQILSLKKNQGKERTLNLHPLRDPALAVRVVYSCAQGETRTPTLLTALAPEASVYTISPPEH